MSLIELILSRKEVLFSLALVLLILIIALLLAVIPTIRRKWKRMMLQRKANRAAKLARLRKQQSMNRRRLQMAAQKEQEQEQAEEVVEVPLIEPVALPEVPHELPNGEVPPEEDPGSVGGEALSPEEAAEAALAGIFDGEFMDDEADQKFQVLMKGIEPVKIEDLADLANSIEDKLLARQPKRDAS